MTAAPVPAIFLRDLLERAALDDPTPAFRDWLLERCAPALTRNERYKLWVKLVEAAQMAESLNGLGDDTIPAHYESRGEVDDSLLTFERDRERFLSQLAPGPVMA